jgi:hypothetical protein
MKAKCPHCESGCNKCTDGFFEVSLPIVDDPEAPWTTACKNQEECGFVNGVCFDKKWIEDRDLVCVMCYGPAEIKSLAEAEANSSYAYEKPENANKWTIKSLERSVETLREKLKKTREVATEYLNKLNVASPSLIEPIPIKHAQLLNICRYCFQPFKVPFLTNCGKEYAHKDCVPK